MAKTIPADEKVFMVSKTTNTTYSGSAALKAMNEWYTMDDVTNTVRPYKVYTALLTQSGGDDPLEVNGVGSLVKGVTYTILENNTPIDLSSFGAPNNNAGTTFCSTLTGPINGDGPDSVILTYNSGAPVATVLENTIGNLWFGYESVGYYNINSNGLFAINKTFCQGASTTIEDGTGFKVISLIPNTESFLNISSANPLVEQTFDNLLNNTPIEIRVYS